METSLISSTASQPFLNNKYSKNQNSTLCANPLAWTLGKLQLDSDMWNLWKNLFEYIENLAFGQVKKM